MRIKVYFQSSFFKLFLLFFFLNFISSVAAMAKPLRSIRKVKDNVLTIVDENGTVLKRLEKVRMEERKNGHILEKYKTPMVFPDNKAFGVIESEEERLDNSKTGKESPILSRKQTFVFYDKSGKEMWKKKVPPGRYIGSDISDVKIAKSGKAVLFLTSKHIMYGTQDGILVLDDTGKEIVNLFYERPYNTVHDAVFSDNGLYVAIRVSEYDAAKKQGASLVKFFELNAGKKLWEKSYSDYSELPFVRVFDDGSCKLEREKKKLIVKKDGQEIDLYEGLDLTSLKQEADIIGEPIYSPNKKFCIIGALKDRTYKYGNQTLKTTDRKWLRFFDLEREKSWDWESDRNTYFDKAAEISNNGDVTLYYKNQIIRLNKDGKEIKQ